MVLVLSLAKLLVAHLTDVVLVLFIVRLLDSLKLFHNSLVEKIYNKSPVSCFASLLVDYPAVLVHASLIIHHIFGKYIYGFMFGRPLQIQYIFFLQKKL